MRLRKSSPSAMLQACCRIRTKSGLKDLEETWGVTFYFPHSAVLPASLCFFSAYLLLFSLTHVTRLWASPHVLLALEGKKTNKKRQSLKKKKENSNVVASMRVQKEAKQIFYSFHVTEACTRTRHTWEPRVINSLVGGFSFLSESLAVFGKLIAMCYADEGANLFPDD